MYESVSPHTAEVSLLWKDAIDIVSSFRLLYN